MLHLATHCTLVIRHLLPAPPRASPDKTSFPQRNHPPLARERNKNSAVRASRSQMAVERSEPSEERSDPQRVKRDTTPYPPQSTTPRASRLPEQSSPQGEFTKARSAPNRANRNKTPPAFPSNPCPRVSRLPEQSSPQGESTEARSAPSEAASRHLPRRFVSPRKRSQNNPAVRGSRSNEQPDNDAPALAAAPDDKTSGPTRKPAPATAARQSTVTEQRDRMPKPRTLFFCDPKRQLLLI